MSGPPALSGGLDRFRFAAALLVVAIHTSPFSSLSPAVDRWFTHVLCRVAVPFFFMVTGYFLLSPPGSSPAGRRPLSHFYKKNLAIYGLATLLYLPIQWYAGRQLPHSLLAWVRVLFFDGTYYHLWYFPAVFLGAWIAWQLQQRLPFSRALLAASLLYLAGLLGDSYSALLPRLPLLDTLYQAGFQLFSYTRNGLFFAPLFLLLGARLHTHPLPGLARPGTVCLGLALLTGEGLLLPLLGTARHDSMYLSLPLCMLALFPLLLRWQCPPSPLLRQASTLVYILHPFCIVALRGLAKLPWLTWAWPGNSLLRYALVCAASLAWAGLIQLFLHRKKARSIQKGSVPSDS